MVNIALLSDRRRLSISPAVAVGVLMMLSGCDTSGQAGVNTGGPAVKAADEGVSAMEDLMREHGVLRRVLLAYQECIRRIDAGEEPPMQAVKDSAGIIREFVEDYHEKMEEDYLFPKFAKSVEQAGLIKTLRAQHHIGRELTDEIVRLADDETMDKAARRAALARYMREFIAMYAPHAAREDTVLFPAVHAACTAKELDALGDEFEDKERELFGRGGFEKAVAKVAAIEKSLGIGDLSKFTPMVPR